MTQGKTIQDLREVLFQTIEGVRNNSVELDKARTINELGKTLIDSAKVEVDFLRVTEGDASSFLGAEKKPSGPALPSPAWPNGGVTQHRLGD